MHQASKQAPSLGSSKRQPIRSCEELVKITPLHRDDAPPMLVECLVDALDLANWATANRARIEKMLAENGGILFRGFAIEGRESLEKFTRAIEMPLMNYVEGATPRKPLGNQVYTSTEFPPEHSIALHNEVSYVLTWPMKICFSCVVAPADRGETPIADVRKVLRRVPGPIVNRFAKKGYTLVRNFSEHLSLPWKTSFRVSTMKELEQYCQSAQIELEVLSNEHVRTRQVRPAIANHPRTGEQVWFNHIAFWHVSSLPQDIREALLSGSSEKELPYNTYYGDGTRIEDEVVEELRQAYDAETVKFPWRQRDLLLLDNMLVAHGRSPFSGPRQIIVSMGEPYSRTDLAKQ